MRPGRIRRLAAGAVLVGALVPAGAGAATACDGGHTDGVRAASHTVRHDLRAHGVLAVASSYLGVPAATIKTDLMNGQSLADVANATSGKSANGLVAAYTAALKTKLDKWVAAGKLTSAKEADILTASQPWLTKLVNAHFTHH